MSAEINDARDVRTVAARVHAHGAADRAGHTDGPFEAGEPGGGASPGRHRQARGPADAQFAADESDELEGRRRARWRYRESRGRTRADSTHCR